MISITGVSAHLPPPPSRDLSPLWNPRSIALVGASADATKWGGEMALRFVRTEKRRPLYFVNRKGGTICGLTAYPSLCDLPEPPEMVYLSMPAVAFEATVEEALRLGAKAIVAILAGLGETGDQGKARERAVAERVRAAGALMIGPNCMGVADTTVDFQGVAALHVPPGSIGWVSMRHPFYSDEQYSPSFYEEHVDYTEAVAKRIDPKEYDPNERVERLLETIASYLRERIPIVFTGYQRCLRGGCREGSDLWDIYSTPGRDGFIILLMDYFHQFIESNDLEQEALKKKMEETYLPISKDRLVTFYHVYQNYLWLSPHPEDSIEARWGLKKCEMILSQLRSAQNSIDFIEKTYRKRDPKYADFSIRQQQEIIRRLIEEWDRTPCKPPPPPTSPKKQGGEIRR